MELEDYVKLPVQFASHVAFGFVNVEDLVITAEGVVVTAPYFAAQLGISVEISRTVADAIRAESTMVPASRQCRYFGDEFRNGILPQILHVYKFEPVTSNRRTFELGIVENICSSGLQHTLQYFCDEETDFIGVRQKGEHIFLFVQRLLYMRDSKLAKVFVTIGEFQRVTSALLYMSDFDSIYNRDRSIGRWTSPLWVMKTITDLSCGKHLKKDSVDTILVNPNMTVYDVFFDDQTRRLTENELLLLSEQALSYEETQLLILMFSLSCRRESLAEMEVISNVEQSREMANFISLEDMVIVIVKDKSGVLIPYMQSYSPYSDHYRVELLRNSNENG